MISLALGPRVIQSHLVPGPGVISAGDGGQEWESRQGRRLGVGSRLVGLHREGLLSGTPLLSRNCLVLGRAVPQGQQALPPSKHQIHKIERNAVYNRLPLSSMPLQLTCSLTDNLPHLNRVGWAYHASLEIFSETCSLLSILATKQIARAMALVLCIFSGPLQHPLSTPEPCS